jgi:hypothetical protein
MPGPRSRRAAALGLLLTLAAVPARALSRSASLLWRYDDITARDPSGTRRRTSWYQGYNADLSGNLLHPLVGTFQAGGAYTQGADVDTSVNQDIPEMRTIGYRGAIQSFGPGLRRFFTLDPNYSIQLTRYSPTSTTPEHTYTNRSWGYSSSLNLPRLPSFSVSRQYNALKDPDGPNPSDQRLNLMREAMYYRIKRISLNASQERIRTDDLRGNVLVPVDKTQRGSLDYGRDDFKALGIRSVTVRTDYLRTARGDFDTIKTVTNLLNLRSRDFRTRDWTHAFNYWNDAQRDILQRTTQMSHNAQLVSNRIIRRGSVTNSLSGNATTGRGGASRSVTLSPGVNLAFLDGRVLTATNGQAGYSRSGAGGSAFSDALGTRVDFKPRRVLHLFVEARTNGIESLTAGGTAGQRMFRYSAGGDRRFSQGEATLRWDRNDQREYASGSRSVSDQVNLLASATPVERLTATAGVNYTTTKSDPGERTESKNARAGLDYSFRWGLRLYTDASFSNRDQYTVNSGAGYSLGKTSVGLRFTQTHYSSSSSYSYLSVSLSRAL